MKRYKLSNTTNPSIHQNRLVTLSVGILLLSFVSGLLLSVQNVGANPVIGFNPGRIIDDAVFTNKNSMSVSDIQTFLNAKGASCTNGEAPCLKNFSEGGRSAAQIIYDTSHQYNINPQTLIVVLQKEVGLVTINQPANWRYRTAMGYGCPDTAACDSQYYGFTNQMRWAATMYNAIMNDSPTWYTPYVLGNNNIRWNPSASCGTSVVNIENRATKALYNYTPYRPNQAALNAGYGLGDSCSSYGNRNFFLYFRDWFGATTDNRLFYRVIQASNAPEVYLQTSAGKYYVPSYSLLEEWGLYPSDVEAVSQSYLSGIPTRTTLSNTLTDGVGNLFVVEGGNTHQVTSPTITSLWNVDVGNMVDSLGLSYVLNRKEPLSRFVAEAGGDGSVWLMDGSERHRVDTGMLYTWGYYPGITNVVSSNLFSRYTPVHSVTNYASSDGGSGVWAIEASTKRPFRDIATRNAYVGSTQVTLVSPATLALLTQGQNLSRFAYDTSSGSWFMIDNGKKYYIQRGELASLWGKPQNESLSPVSPSLIQTIPSAGNLGITARGTSSAAYWLIAKQKHYIENSLSNIALTGSSAAPPVFSDELINGIPQGSSAPTTIRGASSPYNYAYILDKGLRRYPSSPSAQSAWATDSTTMPNELLSLLPEGSFIGTVVRSSDGNAYYVDANKKYLIDPDSHASWGVSSSTPLLDSTSLDRLVSAATLTDTFRVDTTSYIMSGGSRLKINTFKDAYPTAITTSPQVTNSGDMRDGGEVSYLAKSSNTSDQRVWLINKGSKIQLATFEQQVAFGYLSNGITITTLSEDTIAAIPTSSSNYSNLIQTGSSGIKFVNFGHSLGFPDGPTLVAYIHSSSGILDVSSSIYNSFVLRGSTSRLIYDDFGRYFWVEDGQKRYINSWTAYSRDGYPHIPSRYLQGITMNLLPTGQTIQ